MNTPKTTHTAPVARRQTIADALHRTAQRLPAKTAIVCGSTRWSYAEFNALVSRLAAGLQRIGVAEGDKVAVLARNSHGFAALRFALARRGAVLVPINFMLKADEVAYILRHAGARTLATDSGLADLARAAAALDTQVTQFVWLPSEDASEPGKPRGQVLHSNKIKSIIPQWQDPCELKYPVGCTTSQHAATGVKRSIFAMPTASAG